MTTESRAHALDTARELLAATEAAVSPVLAGLEFPAERWQLVMAADDYGAAASFGTRLLELPERRFTDVSEVVACLVSVCRDAAFRMPMGEMLSHLRQGRGPR